MDVAYRSPAVVAPLAIGREVVAERQRRQHVRLLPRGAERNRPLAAAVDAEPVVRVFEATFPEPAQNDVAAAAEDGEVDVSIAVDVERVGACDRRQVGDRRRPLYEAQRAAHRALVAVQRGRLAPTGEEQFGAPVVIAIEHRHTAADEELELPVVGVVDAGRGRLVHEQRGLAGGRRRSPGAPRRQQDRDPRAGRHRECTRDRPSRSPTERVTRPVRGLEGRHVGHRRIEPHCPATVVECGRRTRPLRDTM
jgi:hypothetical protein